MKLDFVEVCGFRGFRDKLRVTFGSGFTVITGRVGSGKTTLLRALLGLLPPDGGEVRWNGAPVAEPGLFFMPPRLSLIHI